MERVRLTGLEVWGEVGVYDFEHGVKQRMVFDVEAWLDLSRAAETDDLAHALDYDGIARVCREVVTSRHHDLIEAIAKEVCDQLMEDARLRKLQVEVHKPGAVPDAADVSVLFSRERDGD